MISKTFNKSTNDSDLMGLACNPWETLPNGKYKKNNNDKKTLSTLI